MNFHKTDINFTWINSKDNKLMPKINLDKRESSRQRLLESLEKNKSKNSTIDTEHNTSDTDNNISSRENGTSNNNMHIDINNNNVINNINLGYDMNNKNSINKTINYSKTYHRKINTFAPENNKENIITNIDNNNKDSYNNNLLNKNKNITIINNNFVNKKHETLNKMEF